MNNYLNIAQVKISQPGIKNNPNPYDPASIAVFHDICIVFDIESKQITRKSRCQENVKYRRLYCYVANILSSDSSNEKSSLVNIKRSTYYEHAKRFVGLLESGDKATVKLWEKYSEESILYHSYSDKFKNSNNANSN